MGYQRSATTPATTLTRLPALRRERVALARHPRRERERVAERDLVLPHDDAPAERARVRGDARDVRAERVRVREQRARVARRERAVRARERSRGGLGARRQRQEGLHVPAGVDEGVREAEVADERADGEFLCVGMRSVAPLSVARKG